MKKFLWWTCWVVSTACSANALADPAGILDPSFGDGFGHQTVGFNRGGSWNDTSQAMVKGPGGTVYLIGHVELDNGEFGIGLARLLHDGQRDGSFGPGGRQFYKDPTFERVTVRDAAMQADGKLVVAGSRGSLQDDFTHMMVCRFESSGAIDVSFGDPTTPGCRSTPSPLSAIVEAYSVLVQSNGRIVLVGHMEDLDGNFHAAAVRLLPDGTEDLSFGDQNIAPGFRLLFPSFVGDRTHLADVAQAASGDLVVTGYIDLGADGNNLDVLVARMKESDGSLDETFDLAGYVFAFFDEGGSNNDLGLAIKAMPDGAVVVSGSAQMGFDVSVPIAIKLDATAMTSPASVCQGKCC